MKKVSNKKAIESKFVLAAFAMVMSIIAVGCDGAHFDEDTGTLVEVSEDAALEAPENSVAAPQNTAASAKYEATGFQGVCEITTPVPLYDHSVRNGGVASEDACAGIAASLVNQGAAFFSYHAPAQHCTIYTAAACETKIETSDAYKLHSLGYGYRMEFDDGHVLLELKGPWNDSWNARKVDRDTYVCGCAASREWREDDGPTTKENFPDHSVVGTLTQVGDSSYCSTPPQVKERTERVATKYYSIWGIGRFVDYRLYITQTSCRDY